MPSPASPLDVYTVVFPVRGQMFEALTEMKDREKVKIPVALSTEPPEV
jgi:hypothetical protein